MHLRVGHNGKDTITMAIQEEPGDSHAAIVSFVDGYIATEPPMMRTSLQVIDCPTHGRFDPQIRVARRGNSEVTMTAILCCRRVVPAVELVMGVICTEIMDNVAEG